MQHNYYKCRKCRVGIMRFKMHDIEVYYECSNFPDCNHTLSCREMYDSVYNTIDTIPKYKKTMVRDDLTEK